MTRELRGEVLHVIAPDDRADDGGDDDEEALVPELRELAASRYVLVCRAGGRPSWLERVVSFLRRDPIEAVTVVTDEAAAEGDEIAATVAETSIPGVYETVDDG